MKMYRLFFKKEKSKSGSLFHVRAMCVRMWIIRCVISHYWKDQVVVDPKKLQEELEVFQRLLNAELPAEARQF